MAEMNQGSPAGSDSTGQGQSGTSAGSENTANQPHMIPKSRFDEVIGQRNEAQRALQERDALIQEMNQRLAAVESRSASPGDSDELNEPPDDASPQERAEYMIRRGIHKYTPKVVEKMIGELVGKELESKLGNVDEFKRTMGANLQEAQRSMIERYESECKRAGIDGSNKSIRSMIAAYARENNTGPEESVRGVVNLLGIKPQGDSVSSADMLSETLTGATLASDAQPRTFQQAWDLAKEGKIAPSATADVLSILNEIDKKD